MKNLLIFSHRFLAALEGSDGRAKGIGRALLNIFDNLRVYSGKIRKIPALRDCNRSRLRLVGRKGLFFCRRGL